MGKLARSAKQAVTEDPCAVLGLVDLAHQPGRRVQTAWLVPVDDEERVPRTPGNSVGLGVDEDAPMLPAGVEPERSHCQVTFQQRSEPFPEFQLDVT